jgi:hypothetical protein
MAAKLATPTKIQQRPRQVKYGNREAWRLQTSIDALLASKSNANNYSP